MKPISRRLHGLADYSYTALVAAAPKLAGFEEGETAAKLCRAMSGGVLVPTALTNAEWGLLRVMPFKMHLALDVLSGVLALGAPWLFGFAGNTRARNTF